MRAIHDCLLAGLLAYEASLAIEQSVRGLDALDESHLHPILSDALLCPGFGVAREVPYPTSTGVGNALRRPKHRERERCDLVILPEPGLTIEDPVAKLIERDAWQGSLFASATAAVRPATLPAELGCWIEVKVVGQFAFIHEVPQANGSYASQLTAALTSDLAKLANDAALIDRAVAVVIFSATAEIAKHDLTIAMHRALDKGVTLRSPIVESFAIQDRIGNAACTLALIQP